VTSLDRLGKRRRICRSGWPCRPTLTMRPGSSPRRQGLPVRQASPSPHLRGDAGDAFPPNHWGAYRSRSAEECRHRPGDLDRGL